MPATTGMRARINAIDLRLNRWVAGPMALFRSEISRPGTSSALKSYAFGDRGAHPFAKSRERTGHPPLFPLRSHDLHVVAPLGAALLARSRGGMYALLPSGVVSTALCGEVEGGGPCPGIGWSCRATADIRGPATKPNSYSRPS